MNNNMYDELKLKFKLNHFKDKKKNWEINAYQESNA